MARHSSSVVVRTLRLPGVQALLLAALAGALGESFGHGQQPAKATDNSGRSVGPTKVVRPPGLELPAPLTPLDNTRSGFNGGHANGGSLGGGFSGGLGWAGSGFSGNFGGSQLQRFPFNIKPDTPVRELLPTAPVLAQPVSPWLVRDLGQVPEVFFQRPPAKATTANEPDPKDAAGKEAAAREKIAARQRAESQTAHTLAKINHLNRKGTDHFVEVLREHRPDLAGLPFVLGDDCRMNPAVSRQFSAAVSQTRIALNGSNGFGGGGAFGGFSGGFAGQAPAPPGGPQPAAPPPPTEDEVRQAKIAAWVQMYAPEAPAQRKELIKNLAAVQHPEATRALARLTIFSFETEVRDAARAALKLRPHDDYRDVLLYGLRYPWPAIAHHAAETVVRLKHYALLDDLAGLLDEPDPRAPAVREVNGRQIVAVREVVRLNHHHNCITCHAPATSDAEFNKSGFTADFVVGAASIPGHELTAPSLGYMFSSVSPDLFVRADVTYLRQDFSLVQPVADAAPWPARQRFDFSVRVREATPKEIDAYAHWRKQRGPGYRVPNQEAALTALRQLTGARTEPTAAAWRAALLTGAERKGDGEPRSR